MNSSISEAQPYRLSAETKDKIGKLSADGLTFIHKIEEVLNKNEQKLSNKDLTIQNPAVKEVFRQGFRNSTKNVREEAERNICLSCYQVEWESQLQELHLLQSHTPYDRDSLYQRVRDSRILAQEEMTKTKTDDRNPNSKKTQPSINTKKEAEAEVQGYDKLERHLNAMSRVEDFTLFRKLDYNFVISRFSAYLQLTKGMAYLEQKKKGDKIIDKYTPGISTKKNEYLYVTYTVEEHPDRMGAFGEGLTAIKEVEITGDPQLVVNLFTSYWLRTELHSGRKEGLTTAIEKMSDYVELKATGAGGYKITITKSNMDVNYETTFGIHPQIKSKSEQQTK